MSDMPSCVLLDPVCAVRGVIDGAVLGREPRWVIGLDDSGWDVQPGTGTVYPSWSPGISARRYRARVARAQDYGLSSFRSASCDESTISRS